MGKRLISFLLFFTMLSFTSGCRWTTPGNAGWKCSNDSQCKTGLRCKRARWKSSGYNIKVCNSNNQSVSEIYGWQQIVIVWILLFVFLLLPVGIFVLGLLLRLIRKSKPPRP
jgi:hypothetical protein